MFYLKNKLIICKEKISKKKTYYLSVNGRPENLLRYLTTCSVFAFKGRKRAEELNERVMIWSIFVTVAIAVCSLGQVLVLKSWFSEKKPSQLYSYN